MNETLKKCLLFVLEVVFATIVWSVLDYLFGDTVNIISNLIDVVIIVLFCNLFDYIAKKIKEKKKNK